MKRGYCGIGIYEPKFEENIGTLWRSAYLFGANFIFSIGKTKYGRQITDTPDTIKHIPYWHFDTFENFKKAIPENTEIICIELTVAKSIVNFTHPERAIYLLGSESKGLPQSICTSYRTIYIPTERNISMNVAVAGSIVLYDRIIKLTKEVGHD